MTLKANATANASKKANVSKQANATTNVSHKANASKKVNETHKAANATVNASHKANASANASVKAKVASKVANPNVNAPNANAEVKILKVPVVSPSSEENKGVTAVYDFTKSDVNSIVDVSMTPSKGGKNDPIKVNFSESGKNTVNLEMHLQQQKPNGQAH